MADSRQYGPCTDPENTRYHGTGRKSDNAHSVGHNSVHPTGQRERLWTLTILVPQNQCTLQARCGVSCAGMQVGTSTGSQILRFNWLVCVVFSMNECGGNSDEEPVGVPPMETAERACTPP